MAYISLGISIMPDQWNDATRMVVNHPRKMAINATIKRRQIDLEQAFIKIEDKYGPRKLATLSATELRDAMQRYVDNGTVDICTHLLCEWFARAHEQHPRRTYMTTWRWICRFIGDDQAKTLTFADIDATWLNEFISFLESNGLTANSQAEYMQHFKAVFNMAIQADVTTNYPFKKIRIKRTQTAKRSMPIDIIVDIFTAVPASKNERAGLDAFRLSFLLLGINMVDLYHLKKTDLAGGRLFYTRSKTGRPYDVRVYARAQELIEQCADAEDSEFLLNFHRKCTFRAYVHKVNLGLREYAQRVGLNISLTSYWARHTWATVASMLDIPKETIANALGHAQNTVTDIYINYNMRKVDDANAQVIALLESKIAMINTEPVQQVTLDDCPY